MAAETRTSNKSLTANENEGMNGPEFCLTDPIQAVFPSKSPIRLDQVNLNLSLTFRPDPATTPDAFSSKLAGAHVSPRTCPRPGCRPLEPFSAFRPRRWAQRWDDETGWFRYLVRRT